MQIIEDHLAVDVPAGVPRWDIDPYAAALLADPIDYYAQLRDNVDSIELTGEARWRSNNALHTLDALPIRFNPK